MSTITITVHPDVADMSVRNIGTVQQSSGVEFLVSIDVGAASILVTSDMLAVLDRLAEMVVEARALLTAEQVAA